jgi:hypothetical protein
LDFVPKQTRFGFSGPPFAKSSLTTSENFVPSAYIRALNRELANTAAAPPSKPDLRQRFLDWHASLPEIARLRPFAMAELEQALGTQGKYLSPVLLSLGWQRRRKWSSRGQYNRYWLPSELGL